MFRIDMFGDSFIYGSEVHNDETVDAVLIARHPDWEILNFGVPAYGIDQAYMRYLEEGATTQSDIVVIDFMSDDIGRSVNTFRTFMRPYLQPVAKPRFVLQSGSLVLVENPIADMDIYDRLLNGEEGLMGTLGRHDAFYQMQSHASIMDMSPSVRVWKIVREQLQAHPNPKQQVSQQLYNIHTEAYQVTAAIIDAFADMVRSHGAVPIFVLIPAYENVIWFQEHGQKIYQTILDHLRGRNERTIDLIDVLSQRKGETLQSMFARRTEGHFSSKGNAMFAKALEEYLLSEQLVPAPPPSKYRMYRRSSCTDD